MIRSLTLCSAVIYMSQEPAGLLEQPRQKREKKRQKEEANQANQVNQANQANQARDHGGFLGWSQLATDGFKNGLTLTLPSFCKLNIKVPGLVPEVLGASTAEVPEVPVAGSGMVPDGSPVAVETWAMASHCPITFGAFDLCSPCVHQHDLTCVDEEPGMKFQCVA